MKLEISDDDLPRVFACLALGAMRAFEAGVPGGGGLYALSAPGTLLPLRTRARISEELASTLSWLSELDTLRDIVSEEMLAAKIGHRADLLEAELRKDNPERIWDVRWLPEADYSAPDLIDLLNRPGPLWLVGAKLAGANLRGAPLRRANLERSDLVVTQLARADLSNANLSGSDLSGAVLNRATLVGADLRHARLRWASLHAANLEGAQLQGANLENCDLTDANLTGAGLERANIRGASVRGTILRGATLLGIRADPEQLSGADLEGAVMTQPPDRPDPPGQ